MLSPRSYCSSSWGLESAATMGHFLAYKTCNGCCVLHNFPFLDRLLHTAFVTVPLGGNKDKRVSNRKGWWGKPSASPGEIAGEMLKVVAWVELLCYHVFAVTHFKSKATVKTQESQEIRMLGNICIYFKAECCSYFGCGFGMKTWVTGTGFLKAFIREIW